MIFSNKILARSIQQTNLANANTNFITRYYQFEADVECRIKRDGFGSVSFHPNSPAAYIFEKGYGQFRFELQLYPDDTYSSPVPPGDYPFEVKISAMMYFEARVVASSGPGLTVFVETCCATPTPNPYSLEEYKFLEDG